MRRIVLMITIAIVLVSLLTGCHEYPFDTANSTASENVVADVENDTANSTASENAVVDVGNENEIGVEEVTIINNSADLGELLGANLTQAQITDVRHEMSTHGFAHLHVFFIGNVDSINLGMPEYGMFVESRLEHNMRANIVTLEMVGLSEDDVQMYWVNHRELLYEPYQIDLYQLRAPRADGSNMLLYTGTDSTTRIDVESIMAE